ncbi:MAG: hypothetical protein JWQ69_4119 [Pseudomonas sp.]|nr:hypothetical protein [Pseudomonas sp.]
MPAIRTEGPFSNIGTNPFATASQPIAGKRAPTDWAPGQALAAANINAFISDTAALKPTNNA